VSHWVNTSRIWQLLHTQHKRQLTLPLIFIFKLWKNSLTLKTHLSRKITILQKLKPEIYIVALNLWTAKTRTIIFLNLANIENYLLLKKNLPGSVIAPRTIPKKIIISWVTTDTLNLLSPILIRVLSSIRHSSSVFNRATKKKNQKRCLNYLTFKALSIYAWNLQESRLPNHKYTIRSSSLIEYKVQHSPCKTQMSILQWFNRLTIQGVNKCLSWQHRQGLKTQWWCIRQSARNPVSKSWLLALICNRWEARGMRIKKLLSFIIWRLVCLESRGLKGLKIYES
jgi:hypothetical protein